MRTESGAAGLLAAALAALAMIVSMMVVDVARVVSLRAQLVTAADAAALAAAPVTFAPFGTDGDPTEAANRIAAGNGADLVECACPIDRSWRSRRVTVTTGASVTLTLLGERFLTVSATAEFQPIALGQR